jgi:hypothetical protein
MGCECAEFHICRIDDDTSPAAEDRHELARQVEKDNRKERDLKNDLDIKKLKLRYAVGFLFWWLMVATFLLAVVMITRSSAQGGQVIASYDNTRHFLKVCLGWVAAREVLSNIAKAINAQFSAYQDYILAMECPPADFLNE